MLILNVTPSVFFEGVNLSNVFFSQANTLTANGVGAVFKLAKAKLVGQSLVLTKCECYSNEYTDSLLPVNQKETDDDAVSAAVNSI